MKYSSNTIANRAAKILVGAAAIVAAILLFNFAGAMMSGINFPFPLRGKIQSLSETGLTFDRVFFGFAGCCLVGLAGLAAHQVGAYLIALCTQNNSGAKAK